jgi:hypothetical protein
MIWKAHISKLKTSFVRIKNEKDRLLWSKNPTSKYTPKFGYIVLSSRDGLGNWVWWSRKLWKFKCPSKAHIFMWLLLDKKTITWNILQKRNSHGHVWCPLCYNDEESNTHLIMLYPYTKHVWKEVVSIIVIRDVYNGGIIEEGLRAWCENVNVKSYKALYVILAWGIWLDRNQKNL